MSGWLTFVLLRHGVERAGWHERRRLQKSPAIHDALSVFRRDGGVMAVHWFHDMCKDDSKRSCMGWPKGFSVFATMVAAFAGGPISAQSVFAVKGPGGDYGVVFGGGIRFSRARPVEIEIADRSLRAITRFERGYESVSTTANGFSGKVTLAAGGARFVVEDNWTRRGEAVTVRRELRVEGSAEGGFVSAITLATGGRVRPEEVDMFVPGLIYGGTRNLTRSAIGGADLYQAVVGENCGYGRIVPRRRCLGFDLRMGVRWPCSTANPMRQRPRRTHTTRRRNRWWTGASGLRRSA
jgi:hypothetical protein